MNSIYFRNYDLSEEVIKAVEKLEYMNPTKVQEQVIPLALNNKDIIVKSQTGSGKTAAFGIPLCEKIDIETREPQVLIITPTRELSVQVKEDISNIGRFKRIRCAAVFGKEPMEIQLRELKQRVHIISGTPGRVIDHLTKGSLTAEKIKYLVIDEADKLLNMGFIEQVEEIINKLPKDRVTMLFSATMPEEIESLCSKYMNDPVKIEITPEYKSTEKIEQMLYEIEESEKFSLLNKIIYIENPESLIIFCNTKEAVINLAKALKNKEFSCNALHGGMEQKDRLSVMKNFKRGEFTILVATDVAARGIDIDSLTHIINYDVPMENESYVHRIGRTGRAEKEGKAITFASQREQKYLISIEDYVGYNIPRKELPSKEEVELGKKNFRIKSFSTPKIKKDKGEKLNKEITKIYINAGKKKKIRPGDIVGTILSIDGITADNIGIIDVQDGFSYIDILDGKGELVLKELQNKTVKGKNVKAQKATK